MRMGLGGAGAPGPLRLGRPLTAHAAVLDVVEHFPDLRTPPESSGTFWKLPGTIPKKPELFLEPEQQLSIYKSLPPDHSGTPRDPLGSHLGLQTTFSNHILIPITTLASPNLKFVDLTGSGSGYPCGLPHVPR